MPAVVYLVASSLDSSHMIPSMSVVSRCSISVRTKLISHCVFSSNISGLVCRLRRQLGVITVARLFTSILVLATFSGAANTLTTQTNMINRQPLFHCNTTAAIHQPDNDYCSRLMFNWQVFHAMTDIRLCKTISIFKRHLKTHLFRLSPSVLQAPMYLRTSRRYYYENVYRTKVHIVIHY